MKIILVDAYNTFIINKWINQEMYELLEKFPNKKIILTNADKEKQQELGLVNLPYEMFTQNFNPMKSDVAYYKNFFDKYNLSIDEVLYFEHNDDAVNIAKSFWIKTYHYDKDVKDLKKLQKFLEDNI